MFKKRLQKNKGQRRKRPDDDGDAPEETEGASITTQLESTKKRRAMLTQLQYRRGVDAAQLSLSSASRDNMRANVHDSKKKNAAAEENSQKEGHVWQQKHDAAMEEYVQNELADDDDNDQPKREDDDKVKNSQDDTKESLYQELAERASELAWKSGEEENSGALTAGAGIAIAEVVLPPQVLQQPQINSNTNRSSAAAFVQNKNLAVPNRFRTTRHNTTDKSTNNNDASKQTAALDHDRSGFLEARKQQKLSSSAPVATRPNRPDGSNNNNDGTHRNIRKSSDDRVYRQFVKRQREQQRR